MDFTRNRLNIIIRILLILVLSWMAFLVMFKTKYWTLSIWILVFVIILTISLIRYFEKSSRHLYRFISAIKSSDFSPTFFLDNKSEIDIEINRVYNEISALFRNLRDEKEFHHQYLQLLK